MSLCMAQYLVARRETTGGFERSIDQFAGQFSNVAVQSRQNLLTVRMTDRNRLDAGADRTQRTLMKIEQQSITWIRAGCRSQCSEDRGVVPRVDSEQAERSDAR